MSIFSAHAKMVHYTLASRMIRRAVFLSIKNKIIKGFMEKYGVDTLVYVEAYKDVNEALHREKCLKKWNRAWKLRLIETVNPEWKDLYEGTL
jgi:putative endonuclease